MDGLGAGRHPWLAQQPQQMQPIHWSGGVADDR